MPQRRNEISWWSKYRGWSNGICRSPTLRIDHAQQHEQTAPSFPYMVRMAYTRKTAGEMSFEHDKIKNGITIKGVFVFSINSSLHAVSA